MLNELIDSVLGAGFNLLVAVLIVRGIYYPRTRTKSYVFTFLAFNTVTYFVMGLLTSVELSVGVGFGLFAIFSLLRYRTAEIPIREMTYLFILIALPVMNSLLIARGDQAELLVANGMTVLLLYGLERGWGFRYEASKRLLYERVELTGPAEREQLLADLRARTGLEVRRVEVGRIDFVRDTAELTIYYDDPAADARSAARQPDTTQLSSGTRPTLEP